ncbi:DNA-(apurinic or apyrimidinic site) lyase 2 [Coprinopsis cinerea okayama7|uniref:DNA-(apurinic or apyrimidinic site) endonuclease 2 n=1 Tax=Coprinopsis cinerea (strain Okayama-7 / 130 / ATCC MYA-4618 / FGSC 9003) TaxID=240176 RepID=A8NAI8_COPC7|nr:DNA-(apurinic or apyrimidinic site) lyase 2 [Coprinopsis cinerea okayama7\|eukprot:XP_001831840.1 DNA-(apurinic or apyrimidinic site) lyase 2 [Coprinopsis cinerea okayama7\
MRLLTWNINGVRTLPQYHPWNTLKTFDDILNHLESDIICFQEMKSGRKLLTQEVAVPPSFDSFFSFPIKKTGYSGVATYTRSKVAVPLKAEEGLSGILQPKPPLAPEERISNYATYPPNLLDDDMHDADDDRLDYKNLDSEGRAIVVDMGLFVLINTYCPNDGTGTEEREAFKMDYHRLLETRVRGLIEKEKREVIVVGDLNACAAVIDHCEGELMIKKGQAMGLEGEEGFWGKEYRRWIRDWLVKEDGTGGTLVDITRKLWPDREGMYTCWNTKISARETNYGTRIDFILVTPGLVPWIKASDTLPNIKGSDHCPVYADFHDSIVDPSTGKTIHLADVLGASKRDGKIPDPPRIAAKNWEEFSGKQTSLQQFFKGSAKKPASNSTSDTPSGTPSLRPKDSLTRKPSSPDPPLQLPEQNVSDVARPSVEASSSASPITVDPKADITASASSNTTKRKLVGDYTSQPKKLKKAASASGSSSTKKLTKNGQSSIASFFSQPSTATKASGSRKGKEKGRDVEMVPDEDEDYKLALLLSQEQGQEPFLPSSQSSQPETQERSKQQWTSLLAPIQPPKCKAHGEPAKEYTVNKPGPNKGKRFFICSRQVSCRDS